ncbi:hypothetical protein Ancab_017432 [Ancistrocladus abbreviatus]
MIPITNIYILVFPEPEIAKASTIDNEEARRGPSGRKQLVSGHCQWLVIDSLVSGCCLGGSSSTTIWTHHYESITGLPSRPSTSVLMAEASSTRADFVYMAKLAEQAERYEEMVEFMENVCTAVGTSEELTVEERNLLSVAYKNVIGARRASWRIISSIEQKEEGRGNSDHVATIREYRAKIESELSSICDGILKLLESRLAPSTSVADSKVFYLKMKGDYHRYLAEFKTGAERKEAAENTLSAYKSAQVLISSR